MGANNNQGQSGNDPRGRSQNMIAQYQPQLQQSAQYQQNRYENQQGPLVQQAAYNYGRGSEANYGDYTDIMNQYRQIASGGGTAGEGGAGGGGGGGGETGFGPELIGYNDPFNSYKGFTEFSNTGGYSPTDIANMRARGVSPVRAAYANAQREIGRQRSLQGGYSPGAFTMMGRMAREQGQTSADAIQNVEAGLAEARNKGRLSGLTGMSDIEKQRLAADLDVAKFNAQAKMSAAASGSAAAGANADRAAAANAANMADRFKALTGMTTLYGTNPGMAETFGNQAINLAGQGGTFGLGMLGQQNATANNMLGANQNAQQLPGAWQQAMGRVGDITDLYGIGSTIAYPFLNQNQNRGLGPAPPGSTGWSTRP